MSTEIKSISDFWAGKKLDSSVAFTKPEHAVTHIIELISTLKGNVIKGDDRDAMLNCARSYLDNRFKLVGKRVRGGEIVALTPENRYLVLTETTSVRRNRSYVRHGYLMDFDSKQKDGVAEDITEHWRTDNELRKNSGLLVEPNDAIRHIRRTADALRAATRYKNVNRTLMAIRNTCEAVERNFFALIGWVVTTNERSPEAKRGPRATDGEVVAILSEGRALALAHQTKKEKYGFVVGRTKVPEELKEHF